MSGSVNLVTLVGRVAQDPVAKDLSGGGRVCNFSVATDKYGTVPEGAPKADFHNVVVYNAQNRKLADLCTQWLRKGREVAIVGRLQTRSWTDQESGKKQYRTEVIANDVQFLGSKPEGSGNGNGNGATDAVRGEAPVEIPAMTEEQLAAAGAVAPEDIPF